jgi:pimeloyl-ACP methyl ester carboxylesterase
VPVLQGHVGQRRRRDRGGVGLEDISDYPGFGHSGWPDPHEFTYTFDRYAEIMNRFTEALGLSRFTPYMQDYGGPVGFRMALAHPERIEAIIGQDVVAKPRADDGQTW